LKSRIFFSASTIPLSKIAGISGRRSFHVFLFYELFVLRIPQSFPSINGDDAELDGVIL
jgi:hypothetical protein